MSIPAADAFFAVFGLTRVGADCESAKHGCAHLFGEVTTKRFRGADRKRYVATSKTCRKCGERSETCLLVKGDDGG